MPRASGIRGRRFRLRSQGGQQGSGRFLGQLRKEQRLIRVHPFRAPTIEAAEQLIQAGLQLVVLAAAGPQQLQQFREHAFEESGIVGQVAQVPQRRRGGRRDAHTRKTRAARVLLAKGAEESGKSGAGWQAVRVRQGVVTYYCHWLWADVAKVVGTVRPAAGPWLRGGSTG